MYLLSSKPFAFTTDYEALQYDLQKKDFLGRLASSLKCFSEYETTASYKPSGSIQAADFISKYDSFEPALEAGSDESEVVLVVYGEQTILKEQILTVEQYLFFSSPTESD